MSPFLAFVFGAALVLALVLARRSFAGFLAQTPADYAKGAPEFDLTKHLNGKILCEGVIYGPLGRVSSRFVGDFEAKWDGDTGTMTEAFTYDSGETQNRAWTLTLKPGGRFTAQAEDLVGKGEGQQSGSAAVIRYKIRLPERVGGHVLDVVDWMYLAPNGTVVNRSQFRKFGLKVAELVATMRPKDEA